MTAPPPLRVTVVYSPQPAQVLRLPLTLAQGSTVADALQASGLLLQHPEVESLTMGIWGRKCEATAVLRDDDRVEVYRPLQVDPMESRRRRQAHRAATRGAEPDERASKARRGRVQG